MLMLAETTTVSTIVREIPADLETPTGLYLKLRGQEPSFLLESIEGGEKIARYSFIGVAPRGEYILRGNEVEHVEGGRRHHIMLSPGSDPTHFLHSELRRFQLAPQSGLPRFIGGLVGYLGFESVRYFEPTLAAHAHASSLPDGIFLLIDTIVAFDHARRSLFLIATVLDGDQDSASRRLDDIAARIGGPLPPAAARVVRSSSPQINMTRQAFEQRVRTAKEHIAAGDIFQVVLSQRFDRETNADPFDVYRAVRRVNPSPYMFFFDFGRVDDKPLALVGSSPEVFARLEGQTASLRPIAGTRPRGADAAADAALAAELLADPKERAEHVMLVDLGRNDLGRVCEFGSIQVSDFLSIERYSHVMHIVSHVAGKLRPGLTAFDLVRAAFPAGTVSGAPKIRAMELISALEAEARGPYAGMVGYFGFDGAMDACLAIRTLVAQGNTFSVQAGAGIVADSDPASEYQETVNKASAMLRAIDMAEVSG
jgi:anthranilate synthase component I